MQDQLQLFGPTLIGGDSRNAKSGTAAAAPTYAQVNTLLAANVLGLNTNSFMSRNNN